MFGVWFDALTEHLRDEATSLVIGEKNFVELWRKGSNAIDSAMAPSEFGAGTPIKLVIILRCDPSRPNSRVGNCSHQAN